jgi:DNA repair protein SbcD/Mre11
MAIRILHTADWHLGQIFHNYDRHIEHTQFLQWLVNLIHAESVNVLLISGDIFDSSNPSTEAQTLYYQFLGKVRKANPNLQIIITAGNHDSAGRLEAPKALLNNMGISVVGKIKRLENNHFDFNKIVVPMYNANQKLEGYCLAIPYLRPADFAHLPENYKNYAHHVSQLYKDAYEFVLQNKEPKIPVIAMGHMHSNAADIANENRADTRTIVGGTEQISSDAFHKDIAYVALGHIHKAQRIGGQEHIRYSGSPLPMSFTEKNYGHEVVVFDLINHKAENIKLVPVPVTASCIAIPKKHDTIQNVINELHKLPDATPDDSKETYPYICVNILIDGPDPERRIKIENALENKQARFVKIDCKSLSIDNNNETTYVSEFTLSQLQPETVVKDMYSKKYQQDMPEPLLELFRNIEQTLDEA